MKFPVSIKRLPWFELFLLAVLLGINGYAASADAYHFPNQWFTRDDAYYYFKVAQNISEGKGSTFDGINPTNGYHPLWLMVCAPVFALARFDLILPLRVLLLLLAGLRAATAIMLYRLLKNSLAWPVAALGALYWAFDLHLHWSMYQQGLETALAAFCLVLFLLLFQRFERERRTAPVRWTQLAGLAGAAVLFTFSRLDLIFPAMLFGLWIVFRNQALRFLLPLDLLSLAASTLGAFLIRLGLPEYYPYAESAILTLAVSVILRVPLFYWLGLYEHPRSLKPLQLIWKALAGVVISTIAIFAILFSLSSLGVMKGSFPRSAPVIDGILTLSLVLASRFVIVLFSQRRKEHRLPSAWKTIQIHWRGWLRDGAVYYGILGGAVGAYMAWNKLVFGTATPVSGEIKRWWGSFSGRVYSGAARYPTSFFGIDSEGDLSPWAPLTRLAEAWNSKIEMRVLPIEYGLRYALILGLLLLALMLLLLINRKRATRGAQELAFIPLLTGSFLQVLSYNITGYAAIKEWYWISQPILIVLAGGLLLDIVTQPLRRVPMVNIVLFMMALYWGITRATLFGRLTIAQMSHENTNTQPPYMEVVAFVENHTEPGSLIGMTGGGNVGYFIRERTIINMDGLINSYAYFQAHKAHQGGEYFAALGMDYIFANPAFIEAIPYRGQYTGQYEILDYYGGKAIMRFLPAR